MSYLRNILLNKLPKASRLKSPPLSFNFNKSNKLKFSTFSSTLTKFSKLTPTKLLTPGGIFVTVGIGISCYVVHRGAKSSFVIFADDPSSSSSDGIDIILSKLEELKESISSLLSSNSSESDGDIKAEALLDDVEVECQGLPPGSPPLVVDDDGNSLLMGAGLEETVGRLESDNAEFDWRQFGEILTPFWKLLFVAVGSAMVVAVINIEIPHLLGQVVDIVTTKLMRGASSSGQTIGGHSLREQDFEFLIRGPAIKLISLYLLQACCTFTYIYSLSVVGEGVATELRRRLFASMLNQDIVFYDTHMTGEIVNRLSSDIQEFKSSFKQCISQGLRSLSQAIGCIISLYMISPEMTKTVILIVPVIITIGSVFGRGLRILSKRAQEQVSKSSGHAEETLSNIRTVRAFAMEKVELDKYSQDIQLAETLNIQLGAGIGLFQGGSSLFLNGIVLSVLYTGGKLISTHAITSGDLMSFLVAAQTIQRSLSNLSLLFGQFVRGMGAGGRVFQYINLPSPLDLTAGHNVYLGDRFDDVKGDVEFHNIWFRYPTRNGDYVLKRFSLRIPRGKVVAVVGASGSGKSTLVNLIEGFYPVEKGEITLDGNRLDMLDPNWLRGDMLGLINQEPVLFATSIMENIRYGKPEATDEEVYQAARNANAFNFIQEFPQGFQTSLGERGVTVSGGQKQRIAIARALIKNPTILILDEATSALDTESEKIVQETLDSVSKGRTVLVIAHRLSTIQNADLIAVVANGRIAELGTHTQLKNHKGLYYNLVKQQEYKAKIQKS